ncbi:MAG: sulfotransferase [Dongiaceae bacterium]
MATEQYPMGVAIMGMMRSGTTLVADLLTVRGKSLIVSEPNLLGKWNEGQTRRTHAIAESFGLDVPPPPKRGTYERNDDYFQASILPQLRTLDWWGVKYVDLYNLEGLFSRYPAKKLILCARDIRDVTLSAIELVERMRLGFDDRKHMRDEAWVFSRVGYTVHEIMALRRFPHFAMRYEDLASDPEKTKEELRSYMEMDALGTERVNLQIEDPSRTEWESKKHADGITGRSLGRYDREPDGPRKRLADRMWRLYPEYSLAFDYEVPPPDKRLSTHPFRLRPKPGDNPIPYLPTENAIWQGPDCIEPTFELRRGRRLVAQNTRANDILLDLGAALPALRFIKPESAGYLMLPPALRRFDTIAAGKLPPPGKATLIAALDLIEYLPDLPRVLSALHKLGRPVLMSYHATDDTDGVDRAAMGWVNNLSRSEFVALLQQTGFRVTAKWGIRNGLSLIRARPQGGDTKQPDTNSEA